MEREAQTSISKKKLKPLLPNMSGKINGQQRVEGLVGDILVVFSFVILKQDIRGQMLSNKTTF